MPHGQEQALTDAEIIARGYRRVSIKHGRVARIDRPDWINVLAAHLHVDRKSIIAELHTCSYQDFYRRVLSNDKLSLGPYGAQHIPPSRDAVVGYIEL